MIDIKDKRWKREDGKDDNLIEIAKIPDNPKFNLKMVELWAQNSSERKGWLKIQNIV